MMKLKILDIKENTFKTNVFYPIEDKIKIPDRAEYNKLVDRYNGELQEPSRFLKNITQKFSDINKNKYVIAGIQRREDIKAKEDEKQKIANQMANRGKDEKDNSDLESWKTYKIKHEKDPISVLSYDFLYIEEYSIIKGPDGQTNTFSGLTIKDDKVVTVLNGSELVEV